jgi:tetratricopeptide (TPR) repeat protein
VTRIGFVLVLAAFAGLANQAHSLAAPVDRVLLKDGRLIQGKLIESDDPDSIMLQLAGVEIPIRNDLIDKTFVEDLEGYVPKNDKERTYLKKGWVLFEDRWMSRTRRETELNRRKKADKKAIDDARDRQKWKNAKAFETTHFEIKSNCPKEVLDDYTERIENYYKNFVGHWNIKVAPSLRRKKMKFFLYRNYSDFRSITRTRPGVQGFFNWVLGELHLYHKNAEPEYSVSVLYHEGNHLLTHLIDPHFRYPTWMNEGMAEYYGSANIDENGDFAVGELQYGRIATLRTDQAKGKLLALEDIVLIPQSAYGGRQYAYGWSFVHFLMDTEAYSSTFRKFFAGLPTNRDIDVENISTRTMISGKEYSIVLADPDLASVLSALEKKLGKSLPELEEEWKEYMEQSYGELTGSAYYTAARLAIGFGELTDEGLADAFDYYQKAVDLGVTLPDCYSNYAELLRKGGTNELQIREPDPELAWEMIQKAIEADPINPFNYTEASGILILDGPVQDLDLALAMTDTALALGGKNWALRNLVDDLLALIEPAREKAAERAEEAARFAELDQREWVVQPAHIDGEEEPEQMAGLSSEDLRELIAAGTIDGEDWVFQTFRMADPDTGELEEPSEPWDKAWVALKDVPDFADDLKAADS